MNPEDVVLLAIAYELKSPGIGQWTKKGWIDGWKNIGCVSTYPLALSMNVLLIKSCSTYRAYSLPDMKNALFRLREQLGSDPLYFEKVYKHTFDFARSEGQRSLGKA